MYSIFYTFFLLRKCACFFHERSCRVIKYCCRIITCHNNKAIQHGKLRQRNLWMRNNHHEANNTKIHQIPFPSKFEKDTVNIALTGSSIRSSLPPWSDSIHKPNAHTTIRMIKCHQTIEKLVWKFHISIVYHRSSHAIELTCTRKVNREKVFWRHYVNDNYGKNVSNQTATERINSVPSDQLLATFLQLLQQKSCFLANFLQFL